MPGEGGIGDYPDGNIFRYPRRMPSRSPSRVTLEQVAAAAGVAVSTASKVLNGRPHVSAETRSRVEAAFEQLAYAPTTGPRGGTAPRSVTVVFRTLADTYAMRVLEGVLGAARDHDVEVLVDVLDPSDGGPGRAAREGVGAAPLTPAWVRRQAAQRVGLVLVTSGPTAQQHALLRAHGVPTVHVDPAKDRKSVV